MLGKVKVLPKWRFSVVTGSGRRQGFFGSDPGLGFGFPDSVLFCLVWFGLFWFGSFSRFFSREVAKI